MKRHRLNTEFTTGEEELTSAATTGNDFKFCQPRQLCFGKGRSFLFRRDVTGLTAMNDSCSKLRPVLTEQERIKLCTTVSQLLTTQDCCINLLLLFCQSSSICRRREKLCGQFCVGGLAQLVALSLPDASTELVTLVFHPLFKSFFVNLSGISTATRN